MRRAFITLYALVVASVLLFGWGLDKVWQMYGPGSVNESQAISPHTFALLAFFLAQQDASQQRQQVAALAAELNADISLIKLDDFAQTSFAERISAGERTMVEGEGGRRYYQRLPNSDSVVGWRLAADPTQRPMLYEILLVVFYLLIALVILIWIWPLSRDLATLEKQTKVVGFDSAPEALHMGPTSAVADLADAFNRMAQRIRDLLTTQKEMTYAVSHELRTPLARMKFGLEMASACTDVNRIHEKLAGVRDDVTEMDLLVNQLLAYAEFDQQQRSLDVQAGDLGALIQHLIERLRESSMGRSVQFSLEDVMGGEPVRCEWYLMERALLNVLQNAGRFARSHVHVRLSRQSGRYRVEVDDDGPGVPEQDRDRVFQSFVRLNNSVNSQVRGFGLGLSIVQRILRWHGGTAMVEHAPSGGARFVLAWPAVIPQKIG